MATAKTRLERVEQQVAVEVLLKLFIHKSFTQLTHSGQERDGSIVAEIGGRATLVQWTYQRHFPLIWIQGGGNAGVDDTR